MHGHPCTTMVGECLWFLIHCGSSNVLSCAVKLWIADHRCSWVAVVRDATAMALATILPLLHERCMESNATFRALAPLLLVLWTTIPGCGASPPSDLLARCNVPQMLSSMSVYQQELLIESAVEHKQYSLWAAAIMANASVTAHQWAVNIVDLEGYGPLSEIVRHFALPDTSDVPESVLDAIAKVLRRLREIAPERLSELDEVSDLCEFVKDLVSLLRKEYHLALSLWPSILALHPGHMTDVSGMCIAGIVQQAVNLDSVDHAEYPQHALNVMVLIERWLQAMGSTAAVEWRADMAMYEHELSNLFTAGYKRRPDDAIKFVDMLRRRQFLQDDSLLAHVANVWTSAAQSSS